MYRTFSTAAFVTLTLIGLSGVADANPITSTGPAPNATATIDAAGGGSGAIDTFFFGGADFFNPGTPVSNFGFQVGSNTGTFGHVTTSGSTSGSITGVSVASAGGTVTVTGTYNGDFSFSRTYQFVAGLDVLRISTSITNNGAAATIRGFDTFDPDQPNSSATTNDVFALASATVAQAIGTAGLTSIIGSADASSLVGFNPTFQGIQNGGSLNAFFTGGAADPNGFFGDNAFSIAFERLLGAGQSTSFSFDLAVGDNAQNAQDAFAAAQVVPEPASLALWSLMILGCAAYCVRRRQITVTTAA
jgi:hypothetical protein